MKVAYVKLQTLSPPSTISSVLQKGDFSGLCQSDLLVLCLLGWPMGRHQQEMEGWWNKDHGALISPAVRPGFAVGAGHSSCQRETPSHPPPCGNFSTTLSSSIITISSWSFWPKCATNSPLLLIPEVFPSLVDFPSSLTAYLSVLLFL